MIRHAKEKRIVARSPIDVALLSRVFLGVLGLAIVVTAAAKFGDSQIKSVFKTEGTQDAFGWLVRWLDVGWAMAALFAAYWCCVIEEGLRLARRFTLIALVVVLAAISLQLIANFEATLRFTNEFGARLPGGIPVGVVLLWTAILLSTRSTLGKFGRLWPAGAAAAAAAGIGAALSWTIEEWMAKPQGWWFWNDPSDRHKVIGHGWLPIAIWALASGAYVLLARRHFHSRDTNGGWIILLSIAIVPLLIGVCRAVFTG